MKLPDDEIANPHFNHVATLRSGHESDHPRADRSPTAAPGRALPSPHLLPTRLGDLAKLVHELRTPISGMLGMIRLMTDDGSLDERQRYRLALITECGQHLLQLVDDILDFARLDARMLHLQPRATVLAELLGDTVAMVQPLAEARGLKLRLSVPPQLPTRLLVDARRLRQVLLNLLSNAIKYTDQGSVQLLVDLDEPSGGLVGPWLVQFNVIDTGRGLSAEQFAQLYQLFRRPSDEPETPNGNGVGLMVARELVGLMGGKLALHSALGQGTQVSFTVPLDSADQPWTPTATREAT